MHALAAGLITGSVIKRASQGDFPTEPAFSVETLEETLIEVNRLFQAEQKIREVAEARIRDLEAERDELRRRADNRTQALNEAQALADKLKSALERLLHTEADPECSEYSAADLLEAQDQARAALRQSDREVKPG